MDESSQQKSSQRLRVQNGLVRNTVLTLIAGAVALIISLEVYPPAAVILVWALALYFALKYYQDGSSMAGDVAVREREGSAGAYQGDVRSASQSSQHQPTHQSNQQLNTRGSGPSAKSKTAPGNQGHSIPRTDYSNYIGYSEIAEDLKSQCLNHLRGSGGGGVGGSALLFGPEGVGKKTLVTHLSGELGCDVQHVSASLFTDAHPGVAKDSVYALLQQNSGNQILLLEDLERVFAEGMHDSETREVYRNVFQQILSYDTPQTFIIGTYNGEKLDANLDDLWGTYYVMDRPDIETRKTLVKKFLKQRGADLSDVDVGHIASWTNQLTAREIEQVLENGLETASREEGAVALYHIERALIDYREGS